MGARAPPARLGARFAELGLRFETAELEALGQNFGKPIL